MKRRLIFACIFSLLPLSYAYAEDNASFSSNSPFSGGVFLGGRTLSISHPSANFNQYNEITPGLFGGGNVVYDKDKYHFSAEGAYLGEDDMYLKLKGGKWGDYKYSLYFTEFPHNLSFEDRTIYTSPGSQSLTIPGTTVPRNSNSWPSTSFDYKYTRRDMGGTFDLTMIRPFFINVDANQVKREGQMPWGANSSVLIPTSLLHSATTQLPLPIDDTTSNINGTFGWKSKQFYTALGGGYSKFSNGAENTTFRDPFPGGATNTIPGAPDNKSYYLKFTGTAKLPLLSTFALSSSFTENTSETNLLNSSNNFPGVVPKGQNTFHGDVQYWNVAANLTSNPWKNLTTKVYYKYFDKKNKSDTVDFVNASTGAVVGSTETYDFQRTTAGAEASYRFLNNLKGILGYEFTDLQRRDHTAAAAPVTETSAIPDTWDNKITAQLVYNPLDWLGARLKYQKLYRGATFDPATGLNPTNSSDALGVLSNYLRPYYAANKTQDMVKGTVDLTPLANLDVTVEYAFKHDTYDKQVLGYYKDQQHEFIVDGSYDWKVLKVFVFFDYDTTWTNQQTRQLGSSGINADPGSGVVNSNSFNWRTNLQNNNYAYGLGSSIPIIKNKLSFVVQYDFEKNNGTADFTSQYRATNIPNADLLNINPYDDYTRQSISARFMCDVTKQFGLTFGYLYSQFRLNDGQLNGYQYVMPVTGTVNTYLTGAYTDQNYNANLFYLKAMYKF